MTLLMDGVVRPGDPGWDEARRSWNLAVDQRPDAVVVATSVEDVQAVLRSGARVAPQATGHGSELLPELDGAVLLKTSLLNAVTVGGGVVRAGAGALAGDIAAAAGEQGLAPVLGLAAGVGVTGLTIGGGTGWLSRAHGLACNNVRAFEVVLASGDRLRVDADHEPELFWALRGGGSFAVVTAVELEAHPVSEVSAGMLAWPAERAAEVLEQFRRWTWDLPESTGAVFRYLAAPGGSPIVAVVAAHLGPHTDGERVLAPLRNGTLMDTFGPIGPAGLVHVAGDPVEPLPTRGDSVLLRELDVDAIAGLLDDLSPLGALEVRLLGGALGRAPRGHGALAKLDAPFSLFAGGPAPDPAAEARLAEVRERLTPWASPARAFDAATLDRLRAVREAYDPDQRLVSAYA
ncbi:FAD-binding oxidoreductase [Solirubrobacter soli]|uniref:FAD-binding oxidoreductase n=1 Tax=Solirubrobacter soli TaxID=363832 RepID=UPI00056494C4|nr:FAD-binding protein [Solirubrobacter soli]